MRRYGFALLLLLAPVVAHSQEVKRNAGAINQAIGRGVNLGNILEAPTEGEWGLTLKPEFFDEIARAGFNSVRIPIRWSAHAKAEAPYTIEPKFFERVDWAIDQAGKNKLVAIINVHHFEAMDKSPGETLPRLVALWTQIAERYRDRPDTLVFELLNEPHDKLTNEAWNRAFPEVLAAVRKSNPHRAVIVGPGNWNNVNDLPKLELPDDDRMLIATFHYYLPFHFTHQGAEWVEKSREWLGETWTGTDEQLKALRADFDKADRWAKEHNRPVFLGEFGAYSKAPMESRVRWTDAVAREAERRGFSWAYWEFGSGFGVYDPAAGRWREPLRAALLPKPTGR